MSTGKTKKIPPVSSVTGTRPKTTPWKIKMYQTAKKPRIEKIAKEMETYRQEAWQQRTMATHWETKFKLREKKASLTYWNENETMPTEYHYKMNQFAPESIRNAAKTTWWTRHFWEKDRPPTEKEINEDRLIRLRNYGLGIQIAKGNIDAEEILKNFKDLNITEIEDITKTLKGGYGQKMTAEEFISKVNT